MADKGQYRKNGDESQPDLEGIKPRYNEVAQKFISDCLEEKARLSEDLPMCSMLIDEAIERVQLTGRIPGRELHADVYKQKPMKLSQTVFVPVKQFPKFNFTGKILGPKGNSLRRLQEETQCKIAIKGRNSMRDREKEETLRTSGDPRHAHLNKNLFLVITTIGTPAECYARVAYALAEIRKYLIPDKNDEVSQEQLRELMSDPDVAKEHSRNNAIKAYAYKSVLASREHPAKGSGFNKYMSLLKRSPVTPDHDINEDLKSEFQEQSSEDEQDPDVERYEYAPIMKVKRAPMPPGYEYTRVRAIAPSSSMRTTQKRVAPSPHHFAMETKRIREYQPPAYKPYTLVKKYH